MTAESAQYVHPTPQIIPARVTIEHLQLRDILQPSSSKGKCLFINRLKVDEVDFNQPQKGPTTFCTLDFRPNCLVTAHGLLAAGGQASELAIRSLSSLSSSPALDLPARQTPWLLRTPTGGSINNAISIQIDPPSPTQDRRHLASSSPTPLAGPSRHRLPKSSQSPRRPSQIEGMWLRDEPRGRVSNAGTHGGARRHRHTLLRDSNDRAGGDMDVDATGDLLAPFPSAMSTSRTRRPPRMTVEEEIEAESAAVAAAYGFIRSSPRSRSAVRKCSEDRDDALSNKKGKSGRERDSTHKARTLPHRGPTRIYVCNNDQSLKIYKLKPPSGLSSSLESGLPSLSRGPALEFPTAVNHSSFSPDGQTLVAVGDTPDVFLYHRYPDGIFTRIATYRATSDASFSTSWHPDGTKFAVASQDGVVSVWDVRSQTKLAELRTHQGAGIGVDVSGLGGANGAARVVKFSPCGRFLAFTEHRLYFHIYDTLTYSKGQRIAIPLSVDGFGSGTSSSAAARHSETPSTFPESRERRSTNHAVGALGAGRWSLDRASSLAEQSNRRSPTTISARLSRLHSSTETAAETLRHASRDLLALQERMSSRATGAYASNLGRDWLSLGTGGSTSTADVADADEAPPSRLRHQNNIDDERRNVIERIALERALAEGWRPEPAEDLSEWLLEDDAHGENSGSSRDSSNEDVRGGEEEGVGGSGSHGGSTQRLFFPHPTERLSTSRTREQDRNREGPQSRSRDQEQPPRAPRLPILRAYSALYSPLGPLGGWGHSGSLGSSRDPSSANLDDPVARAIRDDVEARGEAGDEREAGRSERRQRDRTRDRERERGAGTGRSSGASAFNPATLTGSNASPLATSGSGALAGAIHAHRDEAMNRLMFPEQDAFQNIAGICWDADGECIYVASERLVARYMVSDLRRSMAWGEVR